MTIHRFIDYWEQQSSTLIITVTVFTITLLALINWITGYQISFALFYTLPVAFSTLFCGKRIGIVIAVICATTWQSVNILTGEEFMHPAIPFWNAATRLGFYIIIIELLSAFQRMMRHEKEMSRVDYLTGAVNSRAFYEIANSEILRSQRYRHPFSVAYIDLDNFKSVNDQYGHSTGDDLLQSATTILKKSLRASDIVARLGGDEFALILPEADAASVKSVISKAQQNLDSEMQKNGWPVTFSIGVITYLAVPRNADEMIEKADKLMYQVKTSGKDSVSYLVDDGSPLQI
jgi:diguanylate cyclase (GGDEF)-like protein